VASQNAEGAKSRPPTIDDLLTVCKRLNEKDVKYVLIGGFAVNYYGLPRATEDIDLLVDPSNENILKIKDALSFLPDNAIKEVAPDDVEKYEVVRVADEIVIDLLKKACDVTFDKASIEYFEFKGVRIPVADISTMIKTKQGVRMRDKDDLHFLLMVWEDERKKEEI
jgi:predicted nucleotidyltransferase